MDYYKGGMKLFDYMFFLTAFLFTSVVPDGLETILISFFSLIVQFFACFSIYWPFLLFTQCAVSKGEEILHCLLLLESIYGFDLCEVCDGCHLIMNIYRERLEMYFWKKWVQ